VTAAPLVLLVDDYADTRDLYGMYLAGHGYRIAEAEDGIEAIEKASALAPTVILMDLAMPRLDGWTATERLKSEPSTAGIPIICLTAHTRQEEVARAMRSGCDGFLTKPCLPNVVAAEIERVLQGPREGHKDAT
jgi:CheY-like chemotaxis protein